MKTLKPLFIILGIIVVIALTIVLTSPKDSITDSTDSNQFATTTNSTNGSVTDDSAGIIKKIAITAPKGTIQAEVADTPDAQELGLSGRMSLPRDAGMLFVFADPGIYAFWMKDMNIPLDMVWIGADKKVSEVMANISPDSYPDTTYSPNKSVSYVLELNAGTAAKLGIVAGTQLSF